MNSRAASKSQTIGIAGGRGARLGRAGGASEGARVESIKVVLALPLLGVTVIWVKEAMLSAGRVEVTEKVTGLRKPFAPGITVIWIMAVCPATTEGGFAGPVTV